MNKPIVCCLLMLMICASHAQIYKWVDGQGVMHFSDNPHDGAEIVKTPDPQVYSPPVPPPAQSPEPAVENKSEKSEASYTSIAITQPLDQATIRNDKGYVAVIVQVEPKLNKGDLVQIIFDGSPMGDPQEALLFQLNGIYRGEHTLEAQILNPDGDVLETSERITIYMQRPRVGMVHNNGN
jgi:hypothetical protein